MAKAFTLIFYYIPEDLDDMQIPNAFAIPKDKSEVTLTDIEKFFPLEGQFQFRFQYKHGDAVVWLDLNNKKVKVPQFNEKIVMKVTRKEKKGKPFLSIANVEDLEKDLRTSEGSHFEYQEKAQHDDQDHDLIF